MYAGSGPVALLVQSTYLPCPLYFGHKVDKAVLGLIDTQPAYYHFHSVQFRVGL